MTLTKAKISRHLCVNTLSKGVDKRDIRVRRDVAAANVLIADAGRAAFLDEALPGVTTPASVTTVAGPRVAVIATLAAILAPVTAMMIALTLHGTGNCPLCPVQ